jgi:flavin reductase (DIM6/NTAB) family NADH-FMN oxidoreductase RutF
MSGLPHGKERTVTRSAAGRSAAEHPLELFPYGLMIAGAMDGESPVGIVLTWAMRVSFHPPLVAVAIERESRIRDAVKSSGYFTISFLPRETGTAMAREFLQASRGGWPLGAPLAHSPSRLPRLESALAWLGCRVCHEIATGDHDTVIGEVIEWGGTPGTGEILSLRDTGWRYHR